MPKLTQKRGAEGFGRRLTALLEAAGMSRRGAGAYLAKRYNVSVVTANGWLNGANKPETYRAKQIADDHGSTFDQLYWGDDSESTPTLPPITHQPRDRERARLEVLESDADALFSVVSVLTGALLSRPDEVSRMRRRLRSLRPELRDHDFVQQIDELLTSAAKSRSRDVR